ncbi:hypothetical protein [Paenibacillus sp. R14(2021)]|uniref:hypothetical protein n=1 Tax=Paenibacillus sp. R14(2021) TaxID=2859228 RepID=UPI001C614431|nr:hypothetical protein [Paenibacillus sp. R14(2021)]
MNYWNDAVSYKPYGMYANQGMGNQGMGNQNHCCDKGHKSHKSHRTSGSQNFLAAQVGMNVKINRGGPESLEGKLVSVQRGYVVLKTTGGLVYINASHVKSVTDLAGNTSKSGGNTQVIVAGSFVGVLRQLTQKFVQINWGGPEKIEGFITQVGNESLLLVVGQELVTIPLYHIKTVKTAGMYASNNTKGSNGSGGNKSGKSSGSNKNAANNNTSSKSGGKKSGKTSSTRTGSPRGNKG